ncbi:MAG: ABC transporter permease subunit [Candidatus Poribacteria bacterium]|nr:ABC transporter permease subunit [Candidatus Poribacteria bacterium]
MWHITKREIYDNLNSLRFALTTILLLALMLTNAVVHIREHPAQTQAYHDATAEAVKKLEARSNNLYRLATEGPGYLYKAHSPLRFCAEGDEAFLATYARGENYFRDIANVRPLWRLTYPQETPNIYNIRPNFTTLDWAFIVGYVLSFVAILFTFDSISGEQERGTLRLILANPIPRHIILVGKFLGTFISINIPLTLAVLMNLLLISSSDAVQLNAEAWRRLGILFVIIILYTCLFIALGLLVSAAVRESGVSLVVLLLIWVSFVVFMPNTLASIGSRTSVPMAYIEFWSEGIRLGDEVREGYQDKYGDSQSTPPVHVIAEYLTVDAGENERFTEKYLNQQITQGKRARAITRISPAAIVQHLFESFAGTGLERHLQFIENAKRYAREYRDFVIDTDRADPMSLHAIGVPEGMSQKPVSTEAIPKFKDTLSLNRDFNAAVMDLFLLVLFLVVLLVGAFLAFVRVDV